MKHWKVLIAAAAIAFAVNVSFAGAIKSGIPKGWIGGGAIAERYEVGIDPAEGADNHPALFIAAKNNATKEDFAAITQVIDATAYRGQTMSFSMKVKNFGEHNDYEMWVRTIGEDGSLGDYVSRGAKSDDWQVLKINLIITKKMSKLVFGVGLRSQGKIWVRDLQFEKAILKPEEHRENMASLIPVGDMKDRPLNFNFTE